MSLRLEALSSAHYETAARWLANPSINQWMYAEWRERALDARAIAIAAQNPRNRIWLISHGSSPYGLSGIGAISKTDRSAIAWYLRDPDQVRVPGLMTEAVRRTTAEAFATVGLHSISASVLEPNVASRRVLEGAGYRYAGCLRDGFVFGEGFVDRLVFDCLASDLT